MTDLRCWLCGTQPEQVIEDQRLGDPTSRRIPIWPASGYHQHAANPPTPQQLEDDGHATYRRIMEGAA